MSTLSQELSEEGLLQARQFLRSLQTRVVAEAGASQTAPTTSVLDATLARLKLRGNFEPTDDPTRVLRGGIDFDLMLESERITRAEEIIRRVDPGPCEDPVYLEMLAYQAASIELGLPTDARGQRVNPGWSKFLIGTIHSTELNAFAHRFNSHGYVVVALFSALIEFVYQAAKALVAAQHPVRAADPRFSVSTDSNPEHVAARLYLNQEPIERLYRTLEAYFYRGYPRAYWNESVPAELVLPLTHLIGMAERWIVAHEYGHGFAVGCDWNRGLVKNPKRAEECFADDNATILCAWSAEKLDSLPPYYALIGGTFALACLDVFERGLSIVRHGTEHVGMGDDAHPANKDRALNIFDFYNTTFGVQSYLHPPEVTRPAALAPDDDRIAAEAAIAEGRRLVFEYPNALFKIWVHVRERLLQDFKAKRALHSMWS